MSIRNKIAVKYAVNRTRHIRRSINFNDGIKKSETAVFLMPRVSMEFYLARAVVESLMRYFSRVVLVVAGSMQELVPTGLLRSGSLRSTNRGEIVPVSQESENWLTLPSHDLISRLSSQNFDIAFDLNLSDDIFMSYLCRKSDAKISAGFSKSNCDHFYDMQVNLPANGDVKRAYEILTNIIKMFKEK